MFNSLTDWARRKVTAWRSRRTAALLDAIDQKQVYETVDYESFRENTAGLTVVTRPVNRLFAQDPPLAAPGAWTFEDGVQQRLWVLTHVGERQLAAARAGDGAQ